MTMTNASTRASALRGTLPMTTTGHPSTLIRGSTIYHAYSWRWRQSWINATRALLLVTIPTCSATSRNCSMSRMLGYQGSNEWIRVYGVGASIIRYYSEHPAWYEYASESNQFHWLAYPYFICRSLSDEAKLLGSWWLGLSPWPHWSSQDTILTKVAR